MLTGSTGALERILRLLHPPSVPELLDRAVGTAQCVSDFGKTVFASADGIKQVQHSALNSVIWIAVASKCLERNPKIG